MIDTLWNFSEFLASATMAGMMLFIFVVFTIGIINAINQEFKKMFKD